MFKKTVNLSNFTKLKAFVELANTLPYDIYLVSGGKKADGKSITSIFGLDLTKPITVVADTDLIASLSRKLEKIL